MKKSAFKKQKLKNLSEVQASVIKDFIFEAGYQVKFLTGTPGYLKEIPLLFKDSDITIIDVAEDFTPLSPFLSILSHFKVSDSILDDYCYFPQKKTFRTFLRTGTAELRHDIFVLDDINFEKKTLRQTIISLLEELSEGHFLVLNAQQLCEEAADILHDIENANIKASITFCIDSLDEDNSIAPLKAFFNEHRNDLNFLNISDESDRTLTSDYIKSKFDREFSYSEIMDIFRNNRFFLSISENKKFADIFTKSKRNLTYFPEQQRGINKEIGLAYFYAGEADESILYLNNVIETSKNDCTAAEVYLYLSKVFLYKRNLRQALKYSLLAQQVCDAIGYKELYPIAVMMQYLTTECYDGVSAMELYRNALDVLKKAGYTVNFIYTTNQVAFFVAADTKWKDMILSALDEALALAKEIGDIPEIAATTHLEAVIYSNLGEKDKAKLLYNESNKLRTQMGELPPLLKIRNGLCYEAMFRADYYEAYTLINSIISRLYEITDYSLIVTTIKNCAFAYFFGRHFDKAYELLSQILKFLHIIESKENTFYSDLPNPGDLILYKAYIEFDNGDYVHAKNNCSNLLKVYKELSDVEKPFLHFLQSVIFLSEGNIKLSEEAFEEAATAYEQIFVTQQYRITFMYYEYACTLKRFGYFDKSLTYMQKGFSIALNNKFTFYTKNKTSMTPEEYIRGGIDFEPLNLNMEYLEEKIEKESLLNQLHNRIYEYQFLNKIMTFGAEAANLDEYLTPVVHLLMDYILADSIYIAERTESGWRTIACSAGNDGAEIYPSRWEELYLKSIEERTPFFIYDNLFHQYFRNISRFDFIGGIIIIPSRHAQFSMEMQNVLNLAITNIQAQIVMIKQEEHLLYLSSTDLLSMLKNRRALQEFISNESEKLQRYTPRRRFTLVESIAFVDLDNFKYYNDHFGHEAGDLLIACFAKLLKKICRAVDFVSRFGGDEFVVVMTDTTSENGKIMASRLFQGLKEANFFIPELEKLLGGSLEIPESQYLGFSMGLCSNLDIPEHHDLATVMMNADHALYYAKKHMKGSVALWKDVVELEKEEEN